MPSVEVMLRLHKNLFCSIYALAVLFRRLVCEFREKSSFGAGLITEGERIRFSECTVPLFMHLIGWQRLNYQVNA